MFVWFGRWGLTLSRRMDENEPNMYGGGNAEGEVVVKETDNPYHYAPDMGPCKGYWGPQYSGSQGEQKRMKQSCPELRRRVSKQMGYNDDDWNKRCPNCNNLGTAPWDTPTPEPSFIEDGIAR